jgi:hypothetical protein
MSDELKSPGADERADLDSLGEPLVSLIRAAYTPPDAAAWPDAYWSGLERRIMARVSADEERGWWGVLAPWARVGLAAAAAIFALAGVVNRQITATDNQVAFEAVAQPDMTFASDEPIASQYVPGDDAASLSYFLSN